MNIDEHHQGLLKSLSKEEDKIDLLNDYAWSISRMEIDNALSIAKSNLETSSRLNYTKGIANSHRVMIQCYWLLGNYTEAIHSIEIAERLFTQIKDDKGLADVLNLHGAICAKTKNYEKSILLYQSTLPIRRKLNDKAGETRALNSIGDSLMLMGKPQEALVKFEESWAIQHDDNVYKGIVLYNLADGNFELGNIDQAKAYLEECELIDKNKPFPLKQVYLIQLKARIELKSNRPEKALEMLEESLALAKKIKSTERVYTNYQLMSVCHEMLGDFEKSLSYYKQFHELMDAVVNDDLKETIRSIEYKSEVDQLKSQNEIERLKNVKLKAANAEIKRQRNEIEEKNKELIDSINYAMLPSESFIRNSIAEHFIYFNPKDVLSGDFYWVSDVVTNLNESLTLVAVVDCTGHGIPGALMSIVGNSFFRLCETETSVNSPGEALDFVNAGVQNTLRQTQESKTVRDGMDACMIGWNKDNQTIYFAGAKNPIYIVRKNKIKEIKGNRHSIGNDNDGQLIHFTTQQIPVEKGDMIYMCTDGYQDQFGGEDGKKFKIKNFKNLLLEISAFPMDQQQKRLAQVFNDWKGEHEQVDDVCIFGIRIN